MRERERTREREILQRLKCGFILSYSLLYKIFIPLKTLSPLSPSLSLSFAISFFSLFLLSCNVSCFKSPNLSKGILLKFEKLSNKKPKYIKFCTYFVYSYKWFLVFKKLLVEKFEHYWFRTNQQNFFKVPNCLDPTNQMTW